MYLLVVQVRGTPDGSPSCIEAVSFCMLMWMLSGIYKIHLVIGGPVFYSFFLCRYSCCSNRPVYPYSIVLFWTTSWCNGVSSILVLLGGTQPAQYGNFHYVVFELWLLGFTSWLMGSCHFLCYTNSFLLLVTLWLIHGFSCFVQTWWQEVVVPSHLDASDWNYVHTFQPLFFGDNL